jgi:signal transduction histidine kinase
VEKTTLYYLDANGEDKIEEVYASPIFDEQGKVEQVVEVWRDITERRKEEARLAELHRLASVGMLASGFSHEVNTPLSTMLTCIDSTLSKFKGDNSISDGESKEIIEDAEVIREEILRCKKITGQFLKFSAGQNLTLDLVNVEQAIDVVVKLIGSTARAQGISVKKVVPEKLPAVLANEGALEQVLLNLLLNAIQASRSGDQVMIKCEVDMNELNLIIEDNGKGIEEEELKQIFEPFYSKRPGGTGLGLFLSKIMVKMWGGDIRVSSKPGAGSVFTVMCPLQKD